MPSNAPMSIAGFWRLARQRENDGNLSALRQVGEASILRFFYGVGPSYYQLSAFWERSVPWHSKTQHLSVAAYRKRLVDLNPPTHRKLSQNKLAEKALLKLLGIPSPEYLGYYHPTAGRTVEGEALNNADSLQDYLDQHADVDKLCFKSIEGWGGRGFEPVEILREHNETVLLRLRTKETMSIGKFCRDVLSQGYHASGSMVEKFLVQHDVLANLNPSSVNTLRVWVLQNQDYSTAALLAYLRIGRSEALVDNQSAGGIVAPVDLETGILHAAIDGTPRRRTFSAHPDHGAMIENVQLPFFAEALELAQRSLRDFPHVRFAGIDVAVTNDGSRIIELNVSPIGLALLLSERRRKGCCRDVPSLRTNGCL